MADVVFERSNGVAWETRRKNSFAKLVGQPVPRAVIGSYDEECRIPLEPKKSKIFQLNPTCIPADQTAIQKQIVTHVEYTLARTKTNLTEDDIYRATAHSVRDRLIEVLKDTNQMFYEKDVKRCYYLSLEFLVGRAMQNALVNLDLESNYRAALSDIGYKLETLYEFEHDAALGNGGLGRLAACFLDSMATLNLPCWGYGIRYSYGIFEQKIVDGWQMEHPDYWLVEENPWEVRRSDITYAVRFFGNARRTNGRRGEWTGGQLVQAVAYDNPIPGYDTFNCINLRLWKAAPSKEFDFHSFNEGRYFESIKDRQEAECISAVLYPNDNNDEGKLLRLKQQYFFCCATVQDALRRFKRRPSWNWQELPSKVAFQLNDTHPTIAIPEMLRILVDIEKLDWSEAWQLTKQVFAYTNHTVLPEALEKWSVDLFGKLLPRHLQIIQDINFDFLTDVRNRFGGESPMITAMSVFEEGFPKKVKMANLAVIGSHKVNGVAAIHSQLVKRDLFPHFVRYYERVGEPDKFINVTNGVTPRRWIYCANRPLANLMTQWLGSEEWVKQLDLVRSLKNHLDDVAFIKAWQDVKLQNKKRLARHIAANCGVEVDPNTMLFDVQVKRIHEYKRQSLNVFYMIHRYLMLKGMSPEARRHVTPRCSMIGGKAAPGYATAKTIIKMINNISHIVNNDPDVNQYYKILYLPNYNVSQAQIIIPGADLNHQISTAGTEASGTSNMKFVMNGSLIVGTLDGATVEIREEGGEDTVFLFGLREEHVNGVRERARRGDYPIDGRLKAVYDWIRKGALAMGDGRAHAQFCAFIDQLTNNGYGCNGDFYLVAADFADYCRAQSEVDQLYRENPTKWTQLAVKAAASMGKFSTDRTIKDYSELIWGVTPAERPPPQAPRQTAVGGVAGPSPTTTIPPPMQEPSKTATLMTTTTTSTSSNAGTSPVGAGGRSEEDDMVTPPDDSVKDVSQQHPQKNGRAKNRRPH